MTTVVRLSDYRHAKSDLCFTRQELDQLLSVYSRRVINGEWKDYAITHQPNMAAFFIFRNSSRQASFTVVKRNAGGRATEYSVYHGRERLKRSGSLREALSVLNRRFRLVN